MTNTRHQYKKYLESHNNHVDHLRIVLQNLKDRELFAKFLMCEFFLESMVFLGHILTGEGIRVDT